MTPGEEEISRIYEDGIYRPPDMIKKPGGLWVTGSPTPEYSLSPGAARKTEEAIYETAEDMEDVVD